MEAVVDHVAMKVGDISDKEFFCTHPLYIVLMVPWGGRNVKVFNLVTEPEKAACGALGACRHLFGIAIKHI